MMIIILIMITIIIIIILPIIIVIIIIIRITIIIIIIVARWHGSLCSLHYLGPELLIQLDAQRLSCASQMLPLTLL